MDAQLNEALRRAVEAAETGLLQEMRVVGGNVSTETKRAALTEILLGKNPRRGIEQLVESGAATEVLPELPLLKMEMRAGHRHKDVYLHTLKVLDQAIDLETEGPDLTLRLAALLHDVAKPATRKFEAGGEVSFHGHDHLGGKMVRDRMRELKFEPELTRDVQKLVELHLRTFGYAPGKWSDSAVRRYMLDAGDMLPRLNQLVRADVTTGRREKAERLSNGIDDLEERIRAVQNLDADRAVRPALSGEEVMELLGLEPGREVGRVLKHLLKLKKEGRELTRAEAEAEARRVHFDGQ